MPTLEIREGAINLLVSIYKREFAAMGGYLTDDGEVNLERVEHFIQTVAVYETQIFQKRARIKQAIENNEELRRLKSASTEEAPKSDPDKVKLGEPGYKERYYAEKFNGKTDLEIEVVRKDVVLRYTEGLCWVMRYYYQGVCSWLWYYPYHYAPFASDIKGLADLEITFFPGQPFKPFDQLMGTLPASSSSALPQHYRMLMSDPNSPIKVFYPENFEMDMNGKKFAWQAVVKLPFIEERKLLAETKKLEDTLTDEEKIRNSTMFDILYVHESHPLAFQIALVYRYQSSNELSAGYHCQFPIDTGASGGMNGFLWLHERNKYRSIIPSPVEELKDLGSNRVWNATYLNPLYHKHAPRPPDGVIMPLKVLTPLDIKPFPVLWHEDNNNRRHQPIERPQVSGAISGSILGEAAHRLVRNTLQIKSNSNGSRLLNWNAWGSTFNKSRPAGPSGYEGGFFQDNYFQDHLRNPHTFPYPKPGPTDAQSSRQNIRIVDRSKPEDQRHIQSGISSLVIHEETTLRHHQRVPSPVILANRQYTVQNVGPPPPRPPMNWIDGQPRNVIRTPGFQNYKQQQAKIIYQPRSRPTQSPPNPGNAQ